MRPYSLKRTRNGKFKSVRPRRMRPRLTKKDKRVVRVAVNRTLSKAETMLSRQSFSQSFAITSADYGFTSGKYASSYTWVFNPMMVPVDNAAAGMYDTRVRGSQILIRGIKLDMTVIRGVAADGTTYNTFPFQIRADLIRCPLQLTTSGTSNPRFAPNDGLTNNPLASFWDTGSNGTYGGAGDQYMWSGPPSCMNRRHFKRIKTKILYFPGARSAVTAAGSGGGSVNNTSDVKRFRFSHVFKRGGSKFRYQDQEIGDNNEFGKDYTYYIVLSWNTFGATPVSFSSNFGAFYGSGAVSMWWKDM